jgi:hypothetical protein
MLLEILTILAIGCALGLYLSGRQHKCPQCKCPSEPPPYGFTVAAGCQEKTPMMLDVDASKKFLSCSYTNLKTNDQVTHLIHPRHIVDFGMVSKSFWISLPNGMVLGGNATSVNEANRIFSRVRSLLETS